MINFLKKIIKSKSYKFSLIYLTVALLSFCVLNLVHFEQVNRSKLISEIPISDNLVVVAIDDKSLEKFGTWPWPRQTTASTIEKILSYNPEKVGVDIIFQKKEATSADLNKVLQDNRVVVAKQISLTGSAQTQEIIPEARETGFVNFLVDFDGFVRKVITKQEDNISLSRMLNNDSSIPNSFLLNPKPSLIKTMSLSDLYSNPELGELITGKKVLFGATSMNLGDNHTLPEYGSVAGVYIHAAVLNQIIQKNYPEEPSLNLYQELVIILLIALSLAFFKRIFPIFHYLASFSLITVLLIITFYQTNNPTLSLSFILANILGIIIANITFYSLENNYEKNKLKKTLGLYVSDKVLHQIQKDPNMINLGGEIKNITLLFTDIRNFTSMTEKFGKTTEFGIFLNKILEFQSGIIQKNDGVIDKYIGDAVMAFWGAPVSTSKDTYLAIQSGCEIITELKKFNLKNNSDLRIGIGISFGSAIVGNFGSEKRFNYTAIGDSVNITARLESLNKTYGTDILISKKAIDCLSQEEKECFEFSEVDTIYPKGKEKSVTLYEIRAYKNQTTNELIEHGNKLDEGIYLSGLSLYYAGNFSTAKFLFDKVKSTKAKVLSARCEELLLKSESFKSTWNGIWNFETK